MDKEAKQACAAAYDRKLYAGLTVAEQREVRGLCAEGFLILVRDKGQLVCRKPDAKQLALAEAYGKALAWARAQKRSTGVRVCHDPDGPIYYTVQYLDTLSAYWVTNDGWPIEPRELNPDVIIASGYDWIEVVDQLDALDRGERITRAGVREAEPPQSVDAAVSEYMDRKLNRVVAETGVGTFSNTPNVEPFSPAALDRVIESVREHMQPAIEAEIPNPAPSVMIDGVRFDGVAVSIKPQPPTFEERLKRLREERDKPPSAENVPKGKHKKVP